ncbi:hypothetical protein GF407_11255 [candidate division KSB1 bacterium]|nr:hypothetical protein [candidate division KSB1 bacterium]
MDTIKQIFNSVSNPVFAALGALGPVWGLIVLSVFTGILMLIIFKWASNQSGIKTIKNRIKAHLLELRLYKDDANLSFSALGSIFLNNLKYLAFALKPMIILMIPMIFIIIQIAARYEYRPLQANESVIVSAWFDKNVDLRKVQLQTPKAIKIETPPLRLPSQQRIFWRLRALKAGDWEIQIQASGETVSKDLFVGKRISSLASHRVQKSSLLTLVYTAEASLPSDAAIKEIAVDYPNRDLVILGLHIHWLVLFFALSIVGGYALKGAFGVEI